MTLLQSVLFGIIQGLTEFLPVSSSGHLAIFQSLFGTDLGEGSLSFTVLLHLGTLIAVFIVYRKDIAELVRAFFSLCKKIVKGPRALSEMTVYERMVIYVFIATLPLIPASLLEDKIAFISAHVQAVGIILLINAVMLYFSDRLASEKTPPEKVTAGNALIVGVMQIFAVLPGLSRSGSTITAGLAQGFTREYAVKFSFILSIPAILGACALDLPEFISETVSSGDTAQLMIYLTGALTATAVGIAAIKLLIYISKKSNFRAFSYYSAAAGTAAIIAGMLK